VSGAEWFDRNNFTALPVLVVNPLALYGYGDIRVVPAVSFALVFYSSFLLMDKSALRPSVHDSRHLDRFRRATHRVFVR
jgi:hypothetical protein